MKKNMLILFLIINSSFALYIFPQNDDLELGLMRTNADTLVIVPDDLGTAPVQPVAATARRSSQDSCSAKEVCRLLVIAGSFIGIVCSSYIYAASQEGIGFGNNASFAPSAMYY